MTTNQEQMREAFEKIMGSPYMPKDGTSEYDEWLFNETWQAATSTHAEQIKQLQDRIAELERTKLPTEAQFIEIMRDSLSAALKHGHIRPEDVYRAQYEALKRVIGVN